MAVWELLIYMNTLGVRQEAPGIQTPIYSHCWHRDPVSFWSHVRAYKINHYNKRLCIGD